MSLSGKSNKDMEIIHQSYELPCFNINFRDIMFIAKIRVILIMNLDDPEILDFFLINKFVPFILTGL